MRRQPSRAASTRLENGCDSLMITDVDCDCICRCANPKSVHARSCRLRFCSLGSPTNYLRLKFLDPTAPPPRHGSNVLIRAPLLGVRTASDLCCRDLLIEVSRFLVHTLFYYYSHHTVRLSEQTPPFYSCLELVCRLSNYVEISVSEMVSFD
jgi:hypothetical protein